MEQLLYTKYSNERAREYQIRTDIYIDENGTKKIRKKALTEDGNLHIQSMQKKYETLKKRYTEMEDVNVNVCRQVEDAVLFEYVDGDTLEEQMDFYVKNNDIENLDKLVRKYVKVVKKQVDSPKFVRTEEFERVFGKVELENNLETSDFCNIDLIFTNFICNEKWTIIDYEWMFEFPIPINYVIYRALYYYFHVKVNKPELELEHFLKIAEITEQEREAYAEMEENFQMHITHDNTPLYKIRDYLGGRLVPIGELLVESRRLEQVKEVQIFFDYGQGFSEENSKIYSYNGKKFFLQIELDNDIKQIKIDPAMVQCLITDVRLSWEKEEGRIISSNAIKLDENTFLFLENDPQIVIDTGENRHITIEFSIDLLEDNMQQCLQKQESLYQILKKEYQFENDKLKAEVTDLNYNNLVLAQKQESALKEVFRLEDEVQQLQSQKAQLEQEINNMKNTKVWKFYRKIKMK